jgi:hypothetical protein
MWECTAVTVIGLIPFPDHRVLQQLRAASETRDCHDSAWAIEMARRFTKLT